MKIVHLTDLHVQTRPSLRELHGKRLLGTANLYVLGRRAKFTLEVQRAAVRAAVEENPDVVVITGDLTAQALSSEFEAARELIRPLTDRVPVVLLPGNHDTYIRESTPGDSMRAVLGPWMGPHYPWLHVHDEVQFLVLETCQPHPLSVGWTPPEQIPAALALLNDAPRRFTFLCLHYPLLGRRGEPYGPATRALKNARDVEAMLQQTDAVDAVLHGHEHHGFRVDVPTGGGPVPILNPGSSGYAHLPDQDRTAHFNVYTVKDGSLTGVERRRYDGDRFIPEPGGAYATGR